MEATKFYFGKKSFPIWEKATKLTQTRQLRCPRKGTAGRIAVRRSTFRDSGRVDGQRFREVSTAIFQVANSLPRSGENLHWKEGFKEGASRGMIVVSGAAPQEQRLKQPNGI
jgi:hypothetical protein